MAINGSLDEASLADVLQLLSLGRKTGRLSVSDQSNLGHIYLDAGKITHAFLVNRYHRLGDILFKSGHITQEQLNEAIRLQAKNPKKKVGEILVETGATSESDLSHYMQVQIEEAVYFLFTWRRGDFAFERDVKPDPEDFLVSINPEALLLEGARRVDEWSVIEKKIPSFDMVFTVDRERLESSDATLSKEQQHIASMLDGKRDVSTIVVETGMIEFDVGQALYGLITAGFAEAVGPSMAPGSNGNDGTGHLDREKLLAFLAHQAEFADERLRRQSGLHIADCPTCSKRLQEIHVRRSQGLGGIPEPSGDLSERRSESDRRRADAPASSAQAADRRVHGAGDRRSSTRTAAVQGRSSRERRQPTERRSAARRKRERRRGAPVDRSDRVAVERRHGMERRLQERRAVRPRMGDVTLDASVGQRSTASLRVGDGSSVAPGTASSETASRVATTVRRDTVSVRSAKTRDLTSDGSSMPSSSGRRTVARDKTSLNGTPTPIDQTQPESKAAPATSAQDDEQKVTKSSDRTLQQEPKMSQSEVVPVEQTQQPKRPSIRRMRESPLRGLPLLADGTQWMFIERVDPEDNPLESHSAAPGSELLTPDATTTTTAKDDVVPKPALSQSGAGATAVDIAIPRPESRTIEVEIAAPGVGSATPEHGMDEPKQKSSKWSANDRSKDPGAKKAKLELEKAKAEAEQAKLEAEKVKAEAKKAKSDAEKARAEAEQARLEAKKATRRAEKAESNAERATTKAESVKLDAIKRKSEAVHTRSEAKTAKLEVEKAKLEARKAKAEAESARLEADEATTIADSVKLEAEKVRSEAERAKSEAEKVRSDAERTKLEAEKKLAEAEMAAAPRRRSLSGRGTPVTLRQIVGSASLGFSPANARHADKKPSPPRKFRRTPMVWITIAAVIVMAIATGWLARPFLEAGFGTRAASADIQPVLNAEAVQPALEEVTAGNSPAAERVAEPMRATTAASTARPAQTPVTERPVVEDPPRQTVAVAPESGGLPAHPAPTPIQPEPAALQPPAPASEQQQLDSGVLSADVVPAVTISGSVREVGTGSPLAGALVSLPGTGLTTTTDATGSFSFQGLPPGSQSVTVELEGFLPVTETIATGLGENAVLNLELRGPPNALHADEELDDGQWAVTDLAEATLVLGRPVAVIEGLWIESVARPSTGTRPRVRVAQLTETGDRIVMVISRSGPANVAAVPRVTALRIIPPTEAYPITTGTASFGGLLVTAKATMPAESLRALLQRLAEADGG